MTANSPIVRVFGRQGSEVQILSPRPGFSIAYSIIPVHHCVPECTQSAQHCTRRGSGLSAYARTALNRQTQLGRKVIHFTAPPLLPVFCRPSLLGSGGRGFQMPNDRNRPRLCKKSGVMSPVGKILMKPPLFEAQSHSSSRFTAKRKGKLKSSPTASLRTDFSHSLGRKSPLGSHGRSSSPERRESAEVVSNVVLSCCGGRQSIKTTVF